MRIALVVAALGFALFAAPRADAEGMEVMRVPKALVTSHELANPHLYYPRVSERYTPPPVYGPPPPAGVVRPGEFEEMDSTLITVLNYETQMMTMWTEMIEVYSLAGHTWIVATPASRSALEPRLIAAGIPEDAYSFLGYPVNTIWARDYGPEFSVEADGTLHIVDAYYGGRPLDDAIPILMGAGDWLSPDGSPVEVHSHEHELSGGNVMSDGAGTCFFSHIVYGYEKPAGWTDGDVDDLMREYLGCEQMIVLNPICNDMTGHIDLYAKIVAPTSILLGEFEPDTYFDGTQSAGGTGHCGDSTPDDYQDQEDNLATLEASSNLDGDPWTITRIPLLEPYADGGWVYRSYLNSEIANGRVAMPSYYHPQGSETAGELLDKEAEAVAAYETALPGVEVTPIDVDHMIAWGGAIHCISHEIPHQDGWEPPDTYCGDGVANGAEDCDGEDVGATCQDLGMGHGDYVTCGADCTYVADDCPGPGCGDGVVGDGEECDPCAEEQAPCADWGLGSGSSGCNLDCTINLWSCTDATPCEILSATDPRVLCCPDPPPDTCSDDDWPWPDSDPLYGCCSQDLAESWWCNGGQIGNASCGQGSYCQYIESDDWVDCEDGDLPEPAAPDVDCDADSDSDADGGADGGEDAGGTSPTQAEDGCGCAAAGSARPGSVLAAALAGL